MDNITSVFIKFTDLREDTLSLSFGVTKKLTHRKSNPDYSTTDRFVDIILHKRTQPPDTDFICFEIKKWNNTNRIDVEKDRNNLRVLTSEYGYKYGFYLILGRTMETTKWAIFENGDILENLQLVIAS